MSKTYYRIDEYSVYRWVFGFLGFFCGACFPTFILEKQIFSPSMLIFIILSVAFLTYLIANQRLNALILENDIFSFQSNWRWLKIPIDCIKCLDYQSRFPNHVLEVTYLKKDKLVVKQISLIEFFSLQTIEDFNRAVLQKTPNIEITIDRSFNSFMEKNLIQEYLKIFLNWDYIC